MNKILPLFVLCLGLVACDSHIQTTSGADYLDKYKKVPAGAIATGKNSSLEDQIRKVAAVEPTLKFPARIGLARIDNGRLSTMPGEEVTAWDKVKVNLGKGFGELVPLNPMIADMVSQSVEASSDIKSLSVMDKIRLGAARQHLDAVLIYEVYSKSGSESNILSIANLTIIGGFILPSRALNAEGFANAMLIDVVQGYPYGTVDVIVDKEEVYASSWGSRNKETDLANSVKTKAAIKLSDEAEKMFQKLRLELAEKKAKK
jgi:hypothetical protein